MANVLKMTIVEAIHSLRSAGLSCRAIAKRLGIHRETVSRYVRLGQEPVSKPANAPIFPAGTSDRVAGFEAPTGSAAAGFAASAGSGGRGSQASPWLAWLLEERAKGLSATRIHQDLLPLPPGRFENFREAKRKVSRDGHVEVDRAFYSVPPEYLGHEVWVRFTSRVVRIFNLRMKQIAFHPKADRGRFSTDMHHVPASKINILERGIAYLLGKVKSVGPKTHAWAEAVVAARGIEGHRVVQGLIALTRKHAPDELESACETALSYQCYALRTLRKLIGRQAEHQKPLEFLAEHPLIRPLDAYGQVVARAIHRRQSRPSMGEGFRSHGTGIPAGTKSHRPVEANPRGDAGEGECLWSGYRSPGCSSAEPDSCSPDSPTIAPDPSP